MSTGNCYISAHEPCEPHCFFGIWYLCQHKMPAHYALKAEGALLPSFYTVDEEVEDA